jgi:DNA polymerase IV
MGRVILHIDLDAFFCSVEENRNPSLRGTPFAVGGRPDGRGVVSSCSYAARHFGVRSAMPLARAIRVCPNLTIISPHHKEYSIVSKEIMDLLFKWTDTIEQISIDEAFLDISQLMENHYDLAKEIQAEIRKSFNLPCSIGIASNKLIAKTANDFGKISSRKYSTPQAITIVPEGQEADFLKELPVEALWGVGPKTAQKLANLNIVSIGQLAELPTDQLEKLFGKNGKELSSRSKGIDNRPLITSHEPKSFSNEITFSKDVNDYQILISTTGKLVGRVCSRLRKFNLVSSTIILKLRWGDFTTITRQKSFSLPTNETSFIFEQATHLLDRHWIPDKKVRLIGISVSGLTKSTQQMSFFDKHPINKKTLLPGLTAAVEKIQNQYGKKIIHFGFNQEKDNQNYDLEDSK